MERTISAPSEGPLGTVSDTLQYARHLMKEHSWVVESMAQSTTSRDTKMDPMQSLTTKVEMDASKLEVRHNELQREERDALAGPALMMGGLPPPSTNNLEHPLWPPKWYDKYLPMGNRVQRWMKDPRAEVLDAAIECSRTREMLNEAGDKYAAKFLIQRQLRNGSRMRVRMATIAAGYVLLFSLPILTQWVWPPVGGDCVSQSPDAAASSCFIQPHWIWNTSSALAMMVIAKVLTLDPFRAICGICDAAQRPGFRGLAERLLAIWNYMSMFLLVVGITIMSYKDYFTTESLQLVPSERMLVFSPGGVPPPSDATCTEFVSGMEMASAVPFYYGVFHTALFMAGAVFIALGEFMKLKTTDDFQMKSWVDIGSRLVQNTALQKSEWLQELYVKKAQAMNLINELNVLRRQDVQDFQMQTGKLQMQTGKPQMQTSKFQLQTSTMSPTSTAASPNKLATTLPGAPKAGGKVIEVRDQAIAYVREMASDCIRHPGERDLTQLIFESDVEQVIWPFTLQGFGLTLWWPSYFIMAEPCLGVDGAYDRSVLGLFDLSGGQGDVSYLRNVHIVSLLAVSCLLTIAGVWLIRRSKKSLVNPIFWILAGYMIVFGSYIRHLPWGSGFFENLLYWLGVVPWDPRQIWFMANLLQAVVRCMIARGFCKGRCTPAGVELNVQDEQVWQSRFEVFCSIARDSESETVAHQAAFTGVEVLRLGEYLPLEKPYQHSRYGEGKYRGTTQSGYEPIKKATAFEPMREVTAHQGKKAGFGTATSSDFKKGVGMNPQGRAAGGLPRASTFKEVPVGRTNAEDGPPRATSMDSSALAEGACFQRGNNRATSFNTKY